ncbi:winged helix-turn-helix domain-containing protein [Alteromonas sp. ASW11-130]|uniref:winged helix-turn-helix domain-containing protein n=1 Tax=Alteromonas sp. ASW11-130 TaxID=3015775 RepID=UPI0022423F26|nr:winged helix-turn-helix domain-containing protein [Alteromonas sp. ASW11-130]MCW8091498.1 winged helix-turn-helix domain-containing protein [Alteromonas sp. ASW11-130]
MVRPKTMQLLTLLLENVGDTVSKGHILETVWDDVVVDDQVIFQSIKELRKIFCGEEVIKTIPRKGYIWLQPVEQVSNVADKTANSKLHNRKFSKSFAVICFAIFTMAIALITLSKDSPSDPPISGSLVVLPVNNQINDADHKWVRYGAMDQLIQRLHSTHTAGVLEADYVFDVIARAKAPFTALDKKHIEQIFQVSGANLIVAMTLTGSPNDYQLLYTLYYRDNVEKGTVSNGQVNQAVDNLAGIIGKRLDKDYALPDDNYESSLANEILSNAIVLKLEGEFKQAIDLLNAAIITHPLAIIERRILGQLLVEQRFPFQQAFDVLQQGISQAKAVNEKKELVRLNFWQGVNHLQHGKPDTAQTFFTAAKEGAQQIKDWLYLAYLEEVNGQLYQFEGNFSQANTSYHKAMDYHQVMQCPLGYTNGLMNLSQLAYAQNQHAQALKFAQQALSVAKQRELIDKKMVVEQWLTQLSNEIKPE